jgi:GTP-binding protein
MQPLPKEIKFVKSSRNVRDCPETALPEYAFVGRSNVGKSSLINLLAGRKKLAKTSSTPGKTKLINHFMVDGSWLLVDLPGYGYARVTKTERGKFLQIIRQYLLLRKNLVCLFLLIDCRLAPQQNDLSFIRWLGENQIPFAVCFTKTDKLSEYQMELSFKNYKKSLLTEWEELPPVFFTSAVRKRGRSEMLQFIKETLASRHS